MNQLAASPSAICRVFWLAMMRMKNSTRAGAIRFSAVPPMVWSAFRLTEAKESSRENTAPRMAATSMASSMKPWSATQSPAALASEKIPAFWVTLTKRTPANAPKIIMPSRARLIMPLRSANTPASATIISGTA